MKYFVLILSLLIVVTSFGQRKKKEDEGYVEPTFTEGVVYSLPRTGVRIYASVVNEKFIAGPYNGYAKQLLGINNAPNRNSSKWMIADVKIETFSEPNPNGVFKAMGEVAYLLNLTEDGRLAGINSSESEKYSKKVKTSKLINEPEKNDGFSFDYITDSPFYTEGDSTNNFRPMPVSVEKKAAEAAQRVLECRMNQYYMAAGMFDEFHPDGKAYEVSLKQLKQTEKEYLSLFTGRTTFKKEQFVFDFIPENAAGKGTVLFRISDEKGVVPATDLSGKPVLIEFENENSLSKKYAELAKSENPEAGQYGVFYQIPGISKINIIYELQSIASARTAIAHFGEIAPLPEDLLTGEYEVNIHPETGAIKSIKAK